jgi:hypothetical protein
MAFHHEWPDGQRPHSRQLARAVALFGQELNADGAKLPERVAGELWQVDRSRNVQ